MLAKEEKLIVKPGFVFSNILSERMGIMIFSKNISFSGTAVIRNSLLFLLSLFCFCSCQSGSEQSKESEIIKPVSYISLSDYVLVCPENADASLNRLCLDIRDAVEAETKVKLLYKDDFIKNGDDSEIEGKEILVGNTSRKESDEALKELSCALDYRICVMGDKIVIVGGSEVALHEAISDFIQNIIQGENAMIPENYGKLYRFNREEYLEVLNPVLSFDFNAIENKCVKSSDGIVEARLINALIEGGYSGTAPRFQYSKKGGAVMEPGTIASLWEGKTGYSVSMWLMPYQSIDATIHYRLLSVYGERSKEILAIEYSSPTVYVTVRDSGDKEAQKLSFTYNLDTAVPPFNATHTNDGVWQLLTVTVDRAGNGVRLYINGIEIAAFGDKIVFETDALPEQSKIVVGDCIGGDGETSSRSFNGVIDDVMFFDRALSASDVYALYLTYGESETRSITEDQAFLDAMIEKLGSSLAVKAETSNVIYLGRVVKADVTDYSIKNTVIDDKLYLPSNLCERYFGIVDGTTLTIGETKVVGKMVNTVAYFSAVDICTAMGWNYIDQVSTNGMFLLLAPDSNIDADADTAYITRMIPFCEVGEDEPTITVEQTRVVIADSDTKGGNYTYSPSIVHVGNALYASRDISCLYTEIFRSEDEGKTWNYVGKVEGMWWATIFENNGELYLIGRYTSGGISGSGPHYIGVTKSTDGGVTWSDIDATKGGISYDGGRGVHCAPTPVLKLNGKIYRVFESTSGGNREFIISADENSDLLNPNSWTISQYFSGYGFPNEGNAVMGPDGNVWILARYTANNAFLMRLLEDGRVVGYNGDGSASLIDFPSTANKFTCRYDEKTGKYIALTCPQMDVNCYYQRNYAALCVSDDLIHWELKEILLCDREICNDTVSVAQHAFQYIDWIFDGDDILFVVRESAEDAANFHDSNYLTLYRIAEYANLVK